MGHYTEKINRIYILVLIIAYVAGIDVFVCLKLLGIQELTEVNEQGRGALIPLATCMGLIIALGIAWLELKVFIRWKSLSFGKFAFCKYGLIILLATAGCILVFIMYLLILEKRSMPEAFSAVPEFLTSGIFLSILFFVILFSIVLNMIITIYEYLGPHAIVGALLGRYNQPMEEDLTFLFVDLKSSTSIAERMGHSQYSRFIQDSFQLLTDSIYQYNATIYQFVGDSAVLLWSTKAARKTLAPLELYFDFTCNIAHNSKYFIDEFGETPLFKAAIHTGLVTVTEIQTVKKDIVYHGDVLNTCARILEQCSLRKKDLIVSSPIAQWTMTSDRFNTSFIEQLPLRGKTSETAIYSVNRSH
ncbi:adenylate/guanylate cyclase domain-containing protein [Chryseolinea soli]|nr:adenylate/guanylate cyclase domain-containing protein [Chryseolinea soli]